MARRTMVFTSFVYIGFLSALLLAYWLLRRRRWQNAVLLVASYLFYGWVHPWFCILIALSTIVDYWCGLAMERSPANKKLHLGLSLFVNLGMLGFFKYFGFFVENLRSCAAFLGLPFTMGTLEIMLPVGISFYTFQTLSYTIDIYRGELKARRSFIDFALFVSFFPQLVAGPIERARRFLPQVEEERHFDSQTLAEAWPLLVRGYLKKMVIAESVAPYVDKVFLLSQPSLVLLAAGTVAFALQIYTDFSGYTDIARGSARLFGFSLVENFKSPYLAVSPSDFWRRWHISFSSWIRDYLYISLGGSRVRSATTFFLVLLASLGLSGLWHGASWHFVAWGVFHAVLVFAYHRCGYGGRWRPRTWWGLVLAWLIMTSFTLVGWAIFRCPSMAWLVKAMGAPLGTAGDGMAAAIMLSAVFVYTVPLLILRALDQWGTDFRVVQGLVYGVLLVIVVLFGHDSPQDFIYFRF